MTGARKGWKSSARKPQSSTNMRSACIAASLTTIGAARMASAMSCVALGAASHFTAAGVGEGSIMAILRGDVGHR